MELRRLLAAIALKINTASIKAIKSKQDSLDEIPTHCSCQAALVMFWRMQRTWIHN